jgi:hypothetical protein
MMMNDQAAASPSTRAFKPSSRGGGSKKGKPQAYWPWVLKVIADAVCVRAAGSREAWQRDRRPPFPGATWAEREAAFGRAMDAMCPGWQDWFRARYGDRATPLPELLYNRAYKASNYNGTSARGADHDPATRVGMSSEHWSRHFPSVPGAHPFADLFDAIVHRRVVSVRWERFLDVGKGSK